MKISYRWLKQYLHTDLDPQALGEILTEIGLETEKISKIEPVEGGLNGVVVGEVLACEQHPNADRLKLTRVNVGQSEALHIVCGAPNVAVGQKVAVALVGSTLFPKNAEPLTIKKGKIRGEVSEGMLCAEDELGLGESHAGIMVLPQEALVGSNLAEVLGLESDYSIEIGLTPNRADAMSHYGVARDLHAALQWRGIKSELTLPSVQFFQVQSPKYRVNLRVEDVEACPRYFGLVVDGLKVGPSPKWLQDKLMAIDLKPINNVVDVTNFVMHELGHPLHAFDWTKIEEGTVVVRQAGGEDFTTLDGKARALHALDLCICDAEKPMCLAGVFGGLNSGVSELTHAVFLESAYFNPVRIRKTAKRHGLNTDASFRYERGIDPNMGMLALKRAAILLQEVAGGYVASEIAEVENKVFEPNRLRVSVKRVEGLIGHALGADAVKRILQLLEIKVLAENGDALELEIPPYRVDVLREADVVEEVLRIYGLNNIPFPEKMAFSTGSSDVYGLAALRNKVSEFLVAKGVQECLHNSLHKEAAYEGEDLVRILNPLSQDLGVLRNHPLPNGLESIQRNVNFRQGDLRFFEFGRTYHKTEKGYREEGFLALWCSGRQNVENWNVGKEMADFFGMKALVLGILDLLGLRDLDEKQENGRFYLESKKKRLAEVFEVPKSVLQAYDLEQAVFFAHLNWDIVSNLALKHRIATSEIIRFPRVRRDLALLVDKNHPFADIKACLEKVNRKWLQEVGLFDVYEGKNLPDGKVSYAVKLVLQDAGKTLTDSEIDKYIEKTLKSLHDELGAELRS